MCGIYGYIGRHTHIYTYLRLVHNTPSNIWRIMSWAALQTKRHVGDDNDIKNYEKGERVSKRFLGDGMTEGACFLKC